MSEKEKSYSRAYDNLVDYIISFCSTSTYYDENNSYKNWPGLYGFVGTSFSRNLKPEKGDLIRLESANSHEYRLSWYIEERKHYYKNEDGTQDDDRYESEHLLKSVKTGNLCWWSNVGISYYQREQLDSHPEWKWNDRQFEFKDEWWKLCYNDKDAYIILPLLPEFGENYEVTIGTRTRFGWDDYVPKKTFPDYRKLTKKILGDFYDECVKNRPEKKNG